jgi:hypothetical protein
MPNRAVAFEGPTSDTATGFRISRLPCEVTGIRAMLHMRNNGLFALPTPSESVVEATMPVSLQLVRAEGDSTGR